MEPFTAEQLDRLIWPATRVYLYQRRIGPLQSDIAEQDLRDLWDVALYQRRLGGQADPPATHDRMLWVVDSALLKAVDPSFDARIADLRSGASDVMHHDPRLRAAVRAALEAIVHTPYRFDAVPISNSPEHQQAAALVSAVLRGAPPQFYTDLVLPVDSVQTITTAGRNIRTACIITALVNFETWNRDDARQSDVAASEKAYKLEALLIRLLRARPAFRAEDIDILTRLLRPSPAGVVPLANHEIMLALLRGLRVYGEREGLRADLIECLRQYRAVVIAGNWGADYGRFGVRLPTRLDDLLLLAPPPAVSDPPAAGAGGGALPLADRQSPAAPVTLVEAPAIDPELQAEARSILDRLTAPPALGPYGYGGASLTELDKGLPFTFSPRLRIELTLATLERLVRLDADRRAGWQLRHYLRDRLDNLAYLFQERNPAYTVADLERILMITTSTSTGWSLGRSTIMRRAFEQLELLASTEGLTAELRRGLEGLRAGTFRSSVIHDFVGTLVRIDRLLGVRLTAARVVDPTDGWGCAVLSDIERLEPPATETWTRMLIHLTRTNAGKPSPGWYRRLDRHLTELGTERFRRSLFTWFGYVGSPPQVRASDGTMLPALPHLAERNAHVLRGLIYAAAATPDGEIAAALADVAGAAFQRVAGIGSRSLAPGNAAVTALAALPPDLGVPELIRLRDIGVPPPVDRRIDGILLALMDREQPAVHDRSMSEA